MTNLHDLLQNLFVELKCTLYGGLEKYLSIKTGQVFTEFQVFILRSPALTLERPCTEISKTELKNKKNWTWKNLGCNTFHGPMLRVTCFGFVQFTKLPVVFTVDNTCQWEALEGVLVFERFAVG
ncbi:hypothetical protein C8J56DRAFT_895414 [Mycena floridula]|nr:hypothetical protein C8J56DRAFT_895414 [Mycena floridula]